MSLKDSARDFLSHIDGDYRDICTKYYFEFLKKTLTEDGGKLLEVLFTWDLISNKKNRLDKQFSDEEYEAFADEAKSILTTVIENLINDNLPEEQFYSQLWSIISNSIMFKDDNQRIGALIFLIRNPRIPYFKLTEGITMSDDEYNSIVASVKKCAKKAFFAINRGYKQKTQVASNILLLLDEIEGENEKAVFLSLVLSYYDLRYARALKRINSKIEETN